MNDTKHPVAVNAAEIEKYLRLILSPGQVTELRALDVKLCGDRYRYKTVSGYFDDPAKLAKAAATIETAKGVYFIPNVVNPALLARAENRIRPVQGEPTTADHDIVQRIYLLIDCDAVRPSGISASEAEHAAAVAKAKEIREDLSARGFPLAVLADSGNGAHLLYRIDLPPNDGGLVERCLKALAARFGDSVVKVDTTVHNPARIWKLCGTVAAKGDHTADRPHRMARIIDAPEALEVVPRELLEVLADSTLEADERGAARGKDTTNVRANGKFNLETWISDHCNDMRGPEEWRGGRRWIFTTCPWNSDHTNSSAFIAQLPSGAISAGCHHDGCKAKGWHELRDAVEPGWREKRNGGFVDRGANSKAPAILPEIVPWAAFPVEVLPEPCRRFVVSAALAIGCDPSYVALPMLSALAGTIGNTREIRLKEGSWSEPAVIWTAIVGDSGTMKSPAVDAPLKPIRKRQADASRTHQEALADYERDFQLYEAARQKWKRNPGHEPPPEVPAKPVCSRFLVSDITVEALAERLSHASRGLLLARDELAGWLGSFNQYKGGKGGDSAHWLTMHGARDLIVDRKTGDKTTIFVPRAAVSITGGIQPEILRQTLGREHFQDGLAARLLLAMPPRKPKGWTEATIPPSVESELAELFDRLYELEGDIDENGNPQPRGLRLTPEALRAWIAFVNRHGQEHVALTGDLAAAWSKLEGYAARLALVLHLVSAVAGEADPHLVDEASINAGVTLCEWFKRETRRVYAMLTATDEEQDRLRLVELIDRKGGTITARDLAHADRRDRETAEQKLRDLADAGFGTWDLRLPGPRGGRPTEVFTLLPCRRNRNPAKWAKNDGFGFGDNGRDEP